MGGANIFQNLKPGPSTLAIKQSAPPSQPTPEIRGMIE